jgi:hypothetical protein
MQALTRRHFVRTAAAMGATIAWGNVPAAKPGA